MPSARLIAAHRSAALGMLVLGPVATWARRHWRPG